MLVTKRNKKGLPVAKANKTHEDNPQMSAKDNSAAAVLPSNPMRSMPVGVSANFAKIKKTYKEPSAKVPEGNKVESAKDPGHSDAYLERLKKRAK